MASSSSSPRNFLYDVFTSFAGKDVRKTFLTHFFKELDRKLITVFKDSENTRSESIWPALVHAIRRSRIAVVVISEKYATSSWCLNELLEIMKCKEEFGQMVIPVFYGLNPSQLRDPDGDFGNSFKKTCENKTEDVKRQWQNALDAVSKIFGYHSLNWNNEDKMIEAIVNDLLDKLLVTTSKEFDNYVGLEYHFAQMSDLLHLKSEEVKMVGIWGTSGIGKTIIARSLFSHLSCHFQGSVFIDRHFIYKGMESGGKGNSNDYNMKLHLQNMFLSKILDKKDIEVDHLGVVEERLKHMKVLLFIDLDDQVVLDVLAGENHWFGPGSRIIVITKDKHILRAHGIDLIYEVPLPPQDQALKMFCRYAFKKNSPPGDFMNLTNEVALLAGNLPLGLEVLGRALRGRNIEDWMDMLPRFRSGLDGQIGKTLRVGYDMLDNNEDQELFRIIAFFFEGAEENDMKLLLKDCDLDVTIGLKNLVDKSLIQISGNIVVMHCLLQKLGKEIVRSQSTNPGEQEFLFDAKDICKVLEDNIGTSNIKGISLNLDEIHETDELRINKETFKEMRNLKFLKIYSKKWNHRKKEWYILEDFHYLPPKLRSLMWEDCPLKCMPSHFRPQIMQDNNLKFHDILDLDECSKFTTYLTQVRNICVLDLSNSMIEEVSTWIEYFSNLRRLDMMNCSNLTHADLNVYKLKHLEILFFGYCEALTKVCLKGYRNEVAMEENNNELPVFEEASSSLLDCYLHKVELNFKNCFRLDQEPLLQNQTIFMNVMILPGEEVPSYFTHRTYETSMSIPLHRGGPRLKISVGHKGKKNVRVGH